MQVLVFLAVLFLAFLPFGTTAVRKFIRGREVGKFRWIASSVWIPVAFTTYGIGDYFTGVYFNSLWYTELGQLNRYTTELGVYWATVGWSGLAFLGYVAVSLLLAYPPKVARRAYKEYDVRYLVFGGSILLATIACLVFAFVWSDQAWTAYLQFKNASSFGVNDPVFGHDISFYAFRLPFWQMVVDAFWVMWVAGLIVSLLVLGNQVYWVVEGTGSRQPDEVGNAVINHAISIVAIHIAALFVLLLVGQYLHRFEILFSDRGVVFGAGATDINRTLPGIWWVMVALVLGALSLLIAYFIRTIKTTLVTVGIGIALPILIAIIALGIVPWWYQSYTVSPNEFQAEKQYLQHDLDFTKKAYGLDNLQKQEFPSGDEVKAGILQTDAATLGNIRLTTPQILDGVVSQTQLLRAYYSTPDIDVDRYTINGKEVQVMLAARELLSDHLPYDTWLNRYLAFTHGYGAVVSPVNQFDSEGLPIFWVKDFPPVSTYKELEISQPRIYFGENNGGNVFVKTGVDEIDHPQGENQNAYFKYDGSGGFEVGSGFRRFLIAYHLDDFQVWRSVQIHPESRLMNKRDFGSRLNTLAPFLKWDNDTFQVIADGKIWFMRDGYTTTSAYPYSKPYEQNNDFSGINYIRNAVKATLDSYTGEVRMYVADPNDPIIATWSKVFPGLFYPLSEMPQSLRSHLRYPEDMLNIQADMLSHYHMTHPEIFYNKEALWEIARIGTDQEGGASYMGAYYVSMVRPGQSKPEFMLMKAFSPKSKDPAKPRLNLVGWLGGQCDGEDLGKLILYTFDEKRNVDGPQQVWARINQDTDISKDFTLWHQKGSEVKTGNMIILPLSNNQLLYVLPVYLKATGSNLPQMKRVIVASQGKLGYGENFDWALSELFTETAPLGVESNALAGQQIENANAALSVISRQELEAIRKRVKELLDDIDDKLRKQ